MAISRPPVHPGVTAAQERYQNELVQEVAKAVAEEAVVVVGVSGLKPGKRARQMLDEQKVAYRYLQYGSYLSGWRRRVALKIWLGWPTFPLIFIKGTFIGGASDLKKLIDAGELPKLLGA